MMASKRDLDNLNMQMKFLGFHFFSYRRRWHQFVPQRCCADRPFVTVFNILCNTHISNLNDSNYRTLVFNVLYIDFMLKLLIRIIHWTY